MSSHLSGDEDQEKHHIKDQFGQDEDEKEQSASYSDRQLPPRISERESESTSKDNSLALNSRSRANRRSQSLDAID